MFRGLDSICFRAFDDRRWEPGASSSDIGWGAWSVESGRGQAWTAAMLALREQKTTVWDLSTKSRVWDYFPKLRAEMLPDVSWL